MLKPQTRPSATEAMGHEWVASKHAEHLKLSFSGQSIGSDELNALACCSEVSSDLEDVTTTMQILQAESQRHSAPTLVHALFAKPVISVST